MVSVFFTGLLIGYHLERHAKRYLTEKKEKNKSGTVIALFVAQSNNQREALLSKQNQAKNLRGFAEMKTTFKKLCMAAALTATTSVAYAGPIPINVGGVVWDPDSIFDFTSSTNLVEVTATNIGDVINGYGIINNINATLPASFCPSCELTYEFGGYTLLTDLSSPSVGDSFTFTGGFLKVYVDNTPDYNSDSRASALDGALWLNLLAVDATGDNSGVTLEGSLTAVVLSGGLPTLSGQGFGYFDVVGGWAAGNIDTNGQFGGRDLSYTSDFQPFPSSGTTTDGYTHFGTGDLAGSSIPEPSTIALFGLTLLGLSFARRKMQA